MEPGWQTGVLICPVPCCLLTRPTHSPPPGVSMRPCSAWGHAWLSTHLRLEDEAASLCFSDEDFRGRRQEVPKVEEALREGQ